jgi:hypothetical protein
MRFSVPNFRGEHIWQYTYVHFKTGYTARCSTNERMSLTAFYALLNEWNSKQPGVWQYYSDLRTGLVEEDSCDCKYHRV